MSRKASISTQQEPASSTGDHSSTLKSSSVTQSHPGKKGKVEDWNTDGGSGFIELLKRNAILDGARARFHPKTNEVYFHFTDIHKIGLYDTVFFEAYRNVAKNSWCARQVWKIRHDWTKESDKWDTNIGSQY